ncbi:MAG: hypothetical protein ACXADY_16865 [Candidatus Hodarchaeales archaeon]
MAKNKVILRFCLIGSPVEIKSKWIDKYPGGEFLTSHLIPGILMSIIEITVDSQPVQLFTMHPATKEISEKVRLKQYRGASGAIIIFDMGDRDSYEAVPDWYEEFKADTHLKSLAIDRKGKIKGNYDTPIILVGLITENKDVTTNEGQILANELGISFVETMVDDIENTEQILLNLLRMVLERMKNTSMGSG